MSDIIKLTEVSKSSLKCSVLSRCPARSSRGT